MFGEVRSQIPAKTMLGFVDADDVNRGNPLGADPDKIKTVGPFEVCWDCNPFGMDISGSVAEQITSATRSRKRRRRR